MSEEPSNPNNFELSSAMLAALGLVVVEADPNSRVITYLSPNVEALTGFAAQEFYQPGAWLARIHPDDVGLIPPSHHELRANKGYAVEYRFKTASEEINRYYSFELFFLAGNVAIIFLIGILQALTTAREKDWMERREGL